MCWCGLFMAAAGEVGLMDVAHRAGDRPASQLAPVTPLSSTHGPAHGLGKRTNSDGGDGASAVHNGDVPIAPHSPPDAGNRGSGACPRSPFIAEAYALEGDIDMELAIRRRPVSNLLVPEGELSKLRCNSACEPGDGGGGEPVGARLRSRLGAIRSVSFRLEAAQAPRGAVWMGNPTGEVLVGRCVSLSPLLNHMSVYTWQQRGTVGFSFSPSPSYTSLTNSLPNLGS